jgi:hypothetical protein
LSPGEFATVLVEEADEHDLFGVPVQEQGLEAAQG